MVSDSEHFDPQNALEHAAANSLRACSRLVGRFLWSVIFQDADKFVKMVEVYVRGNSIKYVTIPDEVLDMVQEEDLSKESELLLLLIL